MMRMAYEEQLISQHVLQIQNCALRIQSLSRTFKILEKTEKQVTRKLSTFLNSQKVFETLMKEQIRINFGDS